MNIDFVRDAKELFKRSLEAKGVIIKHDDDPIISWYIYRERTIRPSRRKVVKAKGFSCPPLFTDKLKRLETEIENGANLNSYLSRSIMDCSKDDLMLYDWGIYHLHISDKLDTKNLMDLWKDQTCYYMHYLIMRMHILLKQSIIKAKITCGLRRNVLKLSMIIGLIC